MEYIPGHEGEVGHNLVVSVSQEGLHKWSRQSGDGEALTGWEQHEGRKCVLHLGHQSRGTMCGPGRQGLGTGNDLGE